MSDTLRFRTIGLCILAAFPLFGIGQALLSTDQHALGLFLCLSNSAAVIIVGLFIRPAIATTAPKAGWIYLAARICEGLLLAASVLTVQGGIFGATITSDAFYQLGMIALGLGSLPMCRWLIRSGFVPSLLGKFGFIGYLCLIASMIALAFDFEAVSKTLLLPGAAFEVIFGLVLLLNRRSFRIRQKKSTYSVGLPVRGRRSSNLSMEHSNAGE